MLHDVIGRRETGKTTLTLWLARQGNGPRLIFDPRNGIFPRGDNVKVYTLDDLIDAYPALAYRDIQEIIYTPRENNLRDSFLAFSTVVQAHIEAHPRGRLSVVIDEAALVKDDLESMDHPMQAAMRWSRRDRVHFFLTCHQPKNIPTNTRAITDYLIFFHATQEHDLRVIAERCSDRFAADVSNLKPYAFLIWNDQTAAVIQPTIEPRHWHLDLSEEVPAEPAPIVTRPEKTVDLGNLWL